MFFLNARRKAHFLSGILTILGITGALIFALLVWSYQKNIKADHPIMADITLRSSSTNKIPIYITISPNYTYKMDRLIAQFALYYPDYEVIIAPNNAALDVVLDDIPPTSNKTLPSFNYATLKQNSQVLTGYLLTDSKHTLLFRDFLLSSPAQDILIDDNIDTIEPYRYLSHDYFNANTPIHLKPTL